MILYVLFLASSLDVLHADIEFNPGDDYIVTGEGVVSFQEEFIAPGTRIRISRLNETSVEIEILNSNFMGAGQYQTVSTSWLNRSVRQPTTFELIANAISMIISPPTIEISPECPSSDTSPLAPLTSRRPEPRPAGLAARYNLVKGSFDTARYFDCYRSNQSSHEAYVDQYASAINRISTVYSNDLSGASAEQTSTLLSCLLFRESAHWQGGTSSTGAVGLGQFTGIAIDQVQSILNYNGQDNFDERKAIQQSKLDARRIDANQYRSNLAIIEAEERNYNRMTELQQLWRSFDLRQRPSANEIDRNYLADNNNYETIFALSSLLIRECQLRAQENNIEMNDRLSLLACLGAYNMGYGAFSSNAFNRSGDQQSPEDWIENLLSSEHPQRQETSDHLISIMRCSAQDSNYPPCGTRSTYCQELANSDPCGDRIGLLCSLECR
jgi:hypothetical protein